MTRCQCIFVNNNQPFAMLCTRYELLRRGLQSWTNV